MFVCFASTIVFIMSGAIAEQFLIPVDEWPVAVVWSC